MSKEKGINGVIIVSVFVIFAIAMVYGTLYIFTRQIDTDKYFQNYNTVLKNELKERLTEQSRIDDKIKEISEYGGYTLEEPCILENPYGVSPLSALIIFNTKENTSIKVEINDELVTTIEESKKHIIPIYGLYANSNNVVTLTTESGTKKEVYIQTEALNNFIQEYDVDNVLDKKSHLFLLGDLNSSSSSLRGFDHNNNLIYYLEFGYISAANFYSNNLYIAYNSKYSKSNSLQNLKLEMDYLGRIYSINKSANDLTSVPNLHINGVDYVANSVNLYKDKIKNYEIKKVSDTTSITESTKISTSSIEKQLTEAKTYNKGYDISLNGEYISYYFEDKDITLLMVTKYSNYTYAYELNENDIIKTDITSDASLYIIQDGEYYTLLRTLEL